MSDLSCLHKSPIGLAQRSVSESDLVDHTSVRIYKGGQS